MEITRRNALKFIGGTPVAAGLGLGDTEAQTPPPAHPVAAAHQAAAAAKGPYKPKFFTAHEYATVVVLVDLIIPRDARSGSATDAGVPAFMDFMMIDQPRRQVAMRGGLALLDRLSTDRVGKSFLNASDAQRRQVLDEIAYTTNPDPGMRHAIVFFSSFRDLTASGFWTTKMGIADLQYQGNVFIDEWAGCPDAALSKLGVKYS